MHEGMERSGTACKFTTFSYSTINKPPTTTYKLLTILQLPLARRRHAQP